MRRSVQFATLAVAAWLGATTCAASSTCPVPRLTSTSYDAIEDLLTLRSPTVGSVESFIDCLPDEFFRQSHLTYVTQSRSPEKAEVSVDFPRTILFGKDSKTVIAYTGNPDGAFANQLRIIANEEGPPSRYRFVSVAFHGPGTTPTLSESERDCFSCHRGHLLWSNYRNWEGTFGEHSDVQWQAQDKQQYFDYRKFLATRRDSARYARGIALIRGNDPRSDAGDPRFKPRNPYAPGVGNFLKKLVPAHSRFVRDKFEGSELYDDYRFLLAGTFLSCGWSPEVEREFEADVASLFEGEALGREYRHHKRRLLTEGPLPHVERALWLDRLIMLGRCLGVSLDEWSPELTRSRDVESVGPSFDLASGIEMRDFVFKELVANLGRESETIAAAFAGPKWSAENRYSTFLNRRYRDRSPAEYRNFDRECGVLAPLIEAERARRAAGDAATCFDPASEFELQQDVGVPGPFVTCLECHRPGATRAYAIPIPIDSPELFAAWLGERAHDRRSGKERVTRRVLDRRDMPPAGLGDDELRQIREFLARY